MRDMLGRERSREHSISGGPSCCIRRCPLARVCLAARADACYAPDQLPSHPSIKTRQTGIHIAAPIACRAQAATHSLCPFPTLTTQLSHIKLGERIAYMLPTHPLPTLGRIPTVPFARCRYLARHESTETCSRPLKPQQRHPRCVPRL